MCGSNDVVKQEGFYVCQNCGTKYSVEEAKKLMIEGTVDVKGTVKVDTSDELKNLYEIARRAKDTGNSENALKYYDMILVKDPSSWEANFYVVYFRARSCRIIEIESAAISISNCLSSVFELVRDNVPEDKQMEVTNELYLQTTEIADVLFDASESNYNDTDPEIKGKYTQEFVDRAYAIKQIMYDFGDGLEDVFGDRFGALASYAWKDGIRLHQRYIKYLNNKELNKNQILEYASKVKKFDADYQSPNVDTSTPTNGCYVATAVYGSYNCPEVWTLRRFRDNTLDATWYGRAFIQTYYAISPTLVKWFGETSWFKRLWRRPLDKLVTALRCKGVEDTPYQDKY